MVTFANLGYVFSCNVALVSCNVGRVSCNVARVFCNVACQGYVPLTLDVVRVAFKVPLALHTPL